MDCRTFAVCLLMTVCFIKQSGAQITGFTETGFTVTTGSGNPDVTMTKTAAVPESTAVGSEIFSLTASPTATGGAVTYEFKATTGNPDSIGAIVVASNVAAINVATLMDYETKTTHVFAVVATETGATGVLGTATVTIIVGKEFSKGQFGACVPDGSTEGTVVGTYTLQDVPTGTTITYSITGGNTNTDFAIVGTSGAISVATGKTLAQTTLAGYTLTVNGNDASNDIGTASVWISVQDSCSSGAIQIAAALGIIIASLASMLVI